MRDPLKKAERYRKLAIKFHEMGKSAQPEYLGDFYRGIAVRYLFMAEEVSSWAEKVEGRGAAKRDNDYDAAGVDFKLLARWAGDSRA